MNNSNPLEEVTFWEHLCGIYAFGYHWPEVPQKSFAEKLSIPSYMVEHMGGEQEIRMVLRLRLESRARQWQESFLPANWREGCLKGDYPGLCQYLAGPGLAKYEETEKPAPK